jgi:hypothetical protein
MTQHFAFAESGHRCEWGHDAYSFRVENLPNAPPRPAQQSLFEKQGKR